MIAFDMPSREVCTMRRIPTNTPLQALVTLNDSAYAECATGLADRMIAEGGDAPIDRIAWAYRAATGRAPTPFTLQDLTHLYQKAHDRFVADRDESRHLGPTPEHAALGVVAGAILNLDEVLTK